MKQVDWKKLAASIGLSLLAGFIGSFFTFDAITTWYTYLNKPWFNPPNWIFGPVWTALYILIGTAFYIIWKSKKNMSEKRNAYIFYFLQLSLNALWSIVFFGLRSPPMAFLEVIFFWLSILFTIIYFSKISKIAAYLLYPYIAWVSFASILNATIILLN
jgi:tryptophan-rich sensory protein